MQFSATFRNLEQRTLNETKETEHPGVNKFINAHTTLDRSEKILVNTTCGHQLPFEQMVRRTKQKFYFSGLLFAQRQPDCDSLRFGIELAKTENHENSKFFLQ